MAVVTSGTSVDAHLTPDFGPVEAALKELEPFLRGADGAGVDGGCGGR